MEIVVTQWIKRLLVWPWSNGVCPPPEGWSMQFRDLSCGCKALVLGNGKRLWIVGLTETAPGSCYERSLS